MSTTAAAFGLILFAVLPATANEWWQVKPGEGYSPETYCNWNRTGLPSAQQQVCASRDEKAAAGQATASGNLKAFEANDARAMKTVALANAAVQCGLRSDGWAKVFNDGYAMASDTDVKRFRLSDTEFATASLAGQRVFATTITGVKCRELVNSPTMSHLDEIHDKLTGGYH